MQVAAVVTSRPAKLRDSTSWEAQVSSGTLMTMARDVFLKLCSMRMEMAASEAATAWGRTTRHQKTAPLSPARRAASMAFFPLTPITEYRMSAMYGELLTERPRQAAKKGKPFVFHWRGGYLTKEKAGELIGILERAAAERNRFAKIGLNWPQAVFQADFSEKNPEQAVVYEEANEGELE